MSVYARMGRRAMQSFLSVATFNHELTFNHKIDKIPTTAEADISGATDNFFTTNLNIGSAAKLVQNSDSIFRAAIAKDLESSGKDAGEYLQEVKKKAPQYLEEDDICGRAAVCADFKDVILSKGSLTFVTGGISVGKSKIVKSIVKSIGAEQNLSAAKLPQARITVAMLDGRLGNDILRSLSNIATTSATDVMVQPADVLPMLLAFSSPVGMAVAFDFPGVDFARITVKEAVGVLANWRPHNTDHTVLVLDEANAFFRCIGDDDAEAAAQRARELLNALVVFTKQERRMSVVLVSTDELLPQHLQDLGLNHNHFTKTLVIGEASPRECWDLLREKLGVGEHLSTALIDCYGGNVYQICMLLTDLPAAYESAESKIKMFMVPSSDVSRAISAWRAAGGEEAEFLEVLEELACTGFVPMGSADDKMARLLTKFNVCAYLTKDAKAYHLPEELRANRAGLVPASQLMRVLIASEL